MTKSSIQELLAGVSGPICGPDIAVSGVAYRSDRVRPGDAFFCIPGFAHDGHDYAADAVKRGATALVVQREIDDVGDVVQVSVADTRVALAYASSAVYGHPSRDVRLVGITGTNGKTTTAYLVESILQASGEKTGLVGTVETKIAAQRRDAGRTTPESSDLNSLLAEMRDAGVSSAVMEVSSHAIDLHRVDGLHFEVAAFTNLSQDHLDYHHTLEEYFSVKRRLFTEMDVAKRVINIADPLGAGMALEVEDVITVGSEDADIRARDVVLSAGGSRFMLVTPAGEAQVELPLAAPFNVSNALVAAGCAHALEIPLASIVAGLQSAPQVPGRLERIATTQPFSVYVDYAHTPDSLEKAIDAVREITEGRVLVVFGCGGDRDPDKRPLMGHAAAKGADHAIVTSDNPRGEDPISIILQIEDGMRDGPASYEVEIDRRKAIASAMCQAAPGDAVLIAGKGHEDYQIFADRTIHFDDREVAREELTARC